MDIEEPSRTSKSFSVEMDVEVPMRDGVVLRMNLWGAREERPRPTILVRTPYEKGHSTPAWFVPLCVLEGYAFAIQDCRGHFASDGENQIIMWPQEARDTYDTIEWIADQPFCDGNVAMMGGSYMAMTQWAGAAERPPHLRAIAPAMSTVNGIGEEESGGIPHLHSRLGWLLRASLDMLAKQQAEGGLADESVRAKLEEALGNLDEVATETPLVGLLSDVELPVRLEEMLFGDDRRPMVDLNQVEVPTLSLGGWNDTLCLGTLALFSERSARGPKGAHRLVVGPWAHGGTAQATQGEIDFGPAAPIASSGAARDHLAFFDEHLRSIPSDRPVVRYFLMEENRWHDSPSWPPPGSHTVELYLTRGDLGSDASSKGALSANGPGPETVADCYDYDPDNPVRTHGGKLMPAPGSGYPSGPLAQNVIEARPDVLCYTSQALETSLDAVGPASTCLYVSTDARDTDFVAKLTDVFPDGRSILVLDGAVRLRYRGGRDAEELVEPGRVVEVTITLGHTAWRFERGHRIRLDVTSSNFPHLDRNMNTGGQIGHDLAAVIGRQSVWHGGEHPSRLRLSVAPATPAKK